MLKAQEEEEVSSDSLTALIPDVLPCLRDHNSKVASSALEILELVLVNVPEQTVRSYFKVLWINLVEKLGDSKVVCKGSIGVAVAESLSGWSRVCAVLFSRLAVQLPVREKAVDVVVQLSSVLDVATVFDKLLVRLRVMHAAYSLHEGDY